MTTDPPIKVPSQSDLVPIMSASECTACLTHTAACFDYVTKIAWAVGHGEALRVIDSKPEASSVSAALESLAELLGAVAEAISVVDDNPTVKRAKIVVVRFARVPSEVEPDDILDAIDNTIPYPCTRAGMLNPSVFYGIASKDTVSGIHYKVDLSRRIRQLLEHVGETVQFEASMGQIHETESIREAVMRIAANMLVSK